MLYHTFSVAETHILYAQQQLHQVNRVVPVCAERIDPVPTEIRCQQRGSMVQASMYVFEDVAQVKSDLTKLLCFS